MRTTFWKVSACTALVVAASLNLARGGEEDSVLVQNDVESAGAESVVVPPALVAPANESSFPPPSGPSAATDELATPPQKRPFLKPADPRRRIPATTALDVTAESMPAPDPGTIVESPEFEVRPAPPIRYDTDGDARRMYRRSGELHVVMIAKNPADGCYYEIPMCIPGCCVGEPQVRGGRGLLGRGVVEFCWECGFRAEVKFRHRLGDVKVEYEGD